MSDHEGDDAERWAWVQEKMSDLTIIRDAKRYAWVSEKMRNGSNISIQGDNSKPREEGMPWRISWTGRGNKIVKAYGQGYDDAVDNAIALDVEDT